MKIVLNKQERKSFEGFLEEYALSCVESLRAMNSEESLELLASIEGLSPSELVKVMIKDMDLNVGGLMEVKDLECGGLEVELRADVMTAYNNYMANSMVILRPYTIKLANILYKHEQAIKDVVAKARKLVSLGGTGRVVRGFFTMIGLDGLYNDLHKLSVEIVADKEGAEAMKENFASFEESVTDIFAELNSK